MCGSFPHYNQGLLISLVTARGSAYKYTKTARLTGDPHFMEEVILFAKGKCNETKMSPLQLDHIQERPTQHSQPSWPGGEGKRDKLSIENCVVRVVGNIFGVHELPFLTDLS